MATSPGASPPSRSIRRTASGNTVYLGTTGGGVWKSTNAAGPLRASAFAPLTDTLPVFSANAGTAVIPSLSIGAVSVQSGVVLAGTGDPNDATDSFYGSGLLRSTDGGLTWTLIQQSNDGAAGNHSFVGLGFAGFAWSSASPGHRSRRRLAGGGRHSRQRARRHQQRHGTLLFDRRRRDLADVHDHGRQPDRAASAVRRTRARRQRGDLGGVEPHPPALLRGHSLSRLLRVGGRRHLDATGASTRQPGSPSPPAQPTRTAPAIHPAPSFAVRSPSSPSRGDTFALTVDGNNLDQGLWQDVCGLSGTSCTSNTITFGKQLPSTPLEVGSGSTVIPQADYNLSLAAVPSGADTLLYAGTIDLYRCSLAAGCILRNTTNAINGCAAPAMVAPAQHAIAALANSTLLYIGNDGGLWRSTDGVNQQATPCSADDATHFQNLNSGLGSLAEVISFAQHPTDPATLLVGLGANGTAATSTASASTAWPQLATGEGGTVAIDQTNPYALVRLHRRGRQHPPMQQRRGLHGGGLHRPANHRRSADRQRLLAHRRALAARSRAALERPRSEPAASGAAPQPAERSGPPRMPSANCSAARRTPPAAARIPVLRSLAAAGPASSATAAQNAGSKVLYAGMAGSLDGGGNLLAAISSPPPAADTASSTTAWTDLALSPVTNDAADQA